MGFTYNSCSTLDADNVSERELPSPCVSSPEGGPCAACVGKTRLEPQLVEAKKQLDEAHRAFTATLKQYRESLAQMNRLHNSIVLRVPPEVAACIFKFSLPHLEPDTSLNAANVTQHNRALFALGAVCRDWRRIAWSTPQLWTTFAVYLNDTAWWLMVDPLISQWLSRSGSLPLAIHVAATETQDRYVVLEVAKALKDHCKRWRSLNVQVPARYLPLFSDIPEIPSSFELLKLVGCSDTTELETEVQLGKLRPMHVVLDNIPIGLVSIQWDWVFRADIARMRLDDCYELLKHATSLERCRMSCHDAADLDYNFSDQILVHQRLRELDIRANLDADDLNDFFGSLSLPGLKELKIDFKGFPSKGLISLFRRSCNLEHLHIHEIDLDDNQFIRVLKVTPTIKTLTIQPLTHHSPKTIFTVLTNSAADNKKGAARPKLLPNLQRLRYLAFDGKVVPWDLMPQFFSQVSNSTPLKGGRQLTGLHIHLEDGYNDHALLIDATVIPSLFAIKAAGADLRITWDVRDGVKDLLDPLQLVQKRERYFDWYLEGD